MGAACPHGQSDGASGQKRQSGLRATQLRRFRHSQKGHDHPGQHIGWYAFPVDFFRVLRRRQRLGLSFPHVACTLGMALCFDFLLFRHWVCAHNGVVDNSLFALNNKCEQVSRGTGGSMPPYKGGIERNKLCRSADGAGVCKEGAEGGFMVK